MNLWLKVETSRFKMTPNWLLHNFLFTKLYKSKLSTISNCHSYNHALFTVNLKHVSQQCEISNSFTRVSKMIVTGGYDCKLRTAVRDAWLDFRSRPLGGDEKRVFSLTKCSPITINSDSRRRKAYLPGAEVTVIKKAVPPGRGFSIALRLGWPLRIPLMWVSRAYNFW